MEHNSTLLAILLTPLFTAAIIGIFLRRQGQAAALLSIASAGIQAALVLQILISGWSGGADAVLSKIEWFSVGSFTVDLGFFFDSTAATLLFVVTFVGFLIHLFSFGYMKEDESRGRFYLGLTLFMFSMTGLVLSRNLLMMFIFWELVGLCSYLLIGHYLAKPSASAAANKAFIVNRVGDFGFLLGILGCYWLLGTSDLVGLWDVARNEPEKLSTAIGLLLFCGVLGKSAQAPLHVWLPDAMEGPTPVSALIHAATMVAAGVYMLCRTSFLYTIDALEVITLVGAATAVMAALFAFGVRDIKKVLAYSTLSQLGFLVAVFGLGTQFALDGKLANGGEVALYGVGAAMFHLMTHAFFKALMFLGAGSIIHALHHEQDIYKMGGLWKSMPITSATFAIGVLAIAGIPPLSGFFSKDVILYTAFEQNKLVFGILTFTAFLTATYMGRLWFTVFWGKPKSESAEHAHENGPVMWIPLVVLAILSVVGGFAAIYPESIKTAVYYSALHPEGSDHTLMVAISIIAGGGGLLAAFLIYGLGKESDRLEKAAPPLVAAFRSRFFFDEIYGYYVAKVQQRLAIFLSFLDLLFISGLMVRGTAGLVGLIGFIFRSSTSGNLQSYLYWFLGGVLLLAAYAYGFK